MIGVYRLETQMLPGNGKLERTGLGTDREAKESTNTAFNYLKANANAISGNISTTSKDYIINYQDLNGIGITKHLALPTVIAICSVALSRPTVTGLAVLGDISISGTIMKVEDLANVLQVCLDSGAKKVLLPITSAADIGSVPSELVGAFSLIFYSTPQEAVFKALGVDYSAPGLFKGTRVNYGGGTTDQVDNVTYQTMRGILYITNRRIIFQGDQEGFDLKVDDLVAITPYSNCVELQTSKTHYKIFVPNGNVTQSVLQLIR